MRTSHLIGTLAIVAGAGAAHAEPAYAITGSTGGTLLVAFDTTAPAVALPVGTISGASAGHSVRAIDFRPATGELYAISTNGSTAQLYTMNLSTAALTPVGTGFSIGTSTSTRVSMDFNPVVDRIRVVTGDGINLRVNPITGALVTNDGLLTFDAADVNSDSDPFISDVAYTNNTAGATTTTLYGYDYLLDVIVRIGSVNGTPVSPNAGTVFTVGSSGFVAGSAGMGMDVSNATGVTYLSYDVASINTLGAVNLSTGAVTTLGAFIVDVLDIALPIAPPCQTDLNNDGNTDQGDVDYLINVIAGGANPENIDPDFNNDGNADQGDVDSFINVVAGAPCPQ